MYRNIRGNTLQAITDTEHSPKTSPAETSTRSTAKFLPLPQALETSTVSHTPSVPLNDDKKNTSPQSSTLLAKIQQRLLKLEQALASSEEKGTESSAFTKRGSAKATFGYLYIHRDMLSKEQLQKFADLIHTYMKTALLSRVDIRRIKKQDAESRQILRANQCLLQYREIGRIVQERLPDQWIKFCTNTSKTLSFKGYYQPEDHLSDTSTSETDEPETQPFDLSKNSAWGEYHKEIESRLNGLLMAVLTIRSGLVGKETTLGEMSLFTILKSIPEIGPVLEALVRAVCGLSKDRTAAKIARWAQTIHEIEQFAKCLADTLLYLRHKKLLSLKSEDLSLFTRLEQGWRKIKEEENFSLPRKLALEDMALIINLFSECTPSNALEVNLCVTQNVATLESAFQTHIKEIKETKDSKTQTTPSAVHLTFPLESSKANAWQYASVISLATTEKTDEKTKRLTALKELGSLQLQTDYWQEREERLKQLSADKSPNWQDVRILLKEMKAYKKAPQKSDIESSLWQAFGKVYSEAEKINDLCRQAFNQHVKSINTAEKVKVLHQEVMVMIDDLIELEQSKAAKIQLEHYIAHANQTVEQKKHVQFLETDQTKLANAEVLHKAWVENHDKAMDRHDELFEDTSSTPVRRSISESAATLDEKSDPKASQDTEEKKETPKQVTSSPPTAPSPSQLQLIQATETALGEPPCGFAVLECRVVITKDKKAEYASTVYPPSALLIQDPSKIHHPYWRTYARLLQWHKQCESPSVVDTPSTSVWIATPEALPRHVLSTSYLGYSQKETEQASELFSTYQKEILSHPRAATYGFQALQTLFNQPMPVLPPFEALTPDTLDQALLTPLSNFCLRLGLYHGVPLSDLMCPLEILKTLKTHLNAAFAEDLRVALSWVTSMKQAIARGKKAPQLTEQEYSMLKQHHFHTVQALWETRQTYDATFTFISNLTSKTPTPLDPLLAWAKREASRQADDQKIDNALDFLAEVILYRKFNEKQHHQHLQAIPLKHQLRYLNRLEPTLAERLRHLPSPDGQRLMQEEEKRKWETDLQGLWQSPDRKDDAKASFKDGEPPALTGSALASPKVGESIRARRELTISPKADKPPALTKSPLASPKADEPSAL